MFVVDRCEVGSGIHAAKPAKRFEASEPIRQGMRTKFSGFAAGLAAGLELRPRKRQPVHERCVRCGRRFVFRGSSLPPFIRQPEGNGYVEHFIDTLKERLLWPRGFRNLEELREALLTFKEQYNEHWLIERNGLRSPRQIVRTCLPLEPRRPSSPEGCIGCIVTNPETSPHLE